SSMPIPTFAFITPQPTPLGLTKSKSGSPRFNATLFLEAFSLRSMTWRASSCVTSATTIKPLHPSAGSTKILQQESAQLLYEDQTCPTRDRNMVTGLARRCRVCARRVSLAWRLTEVGKASGRKYYRTDKGQATYLRRKAKRKQVKQLTERN